VKQLATAQEELAEPTTADSSLIVEQLQDKQDEIERLQDLLEKEENQLSETQKVLADLKEAYTIAEERTQNAIADREKFQDKNREYIHKMQNMKDQLDDKDEVIEGHEAKLSLLKDEN